MNIKQIPPKQNKQNTTQQKKIDFECKIHFNELLNQTH